jgi:hypothetical protein
MQRRVAMLKIWPFFIMQVFPNSTDKLQTTAMIGWKGIEYNVREKGALL